MSKKPRKTKRKTQNNINKAPKTRSYRLGRRTFMTAGVAALLGIPAYYGVSAYIANQEILHDLSAIGSGRPVLVQIHDPQCPRCQTLLSSVESVLPEFPSVDFRIANIKTGSGSVFARRHDVSNVTLLMFNARGQKVDTGVGLQDKDEVRNFLRHHVEG